MEELSLYDVNPYDMDLKEKNIKLLGRMNNLTAMHYVKCDLYGRFIQTSQNKDEKSGELSDIPFIPVRLFKERELISIPKEEVIKTLTSSGTSGQQVSKIYLDRTTAANQQKALVKIVSDFTGKTRMPMIIIDCPSVVKDRTMFSARGAGILGFSIFATKKIYALDDDMKLDVEGLRAFLESHGGERILLFGFTFMIWQHFYKELYRILQETGERFDLSNAVMIHGGGWKKLINEAVSRDEFHERLESVCGLCNIHDYYGMVEQTGCIYMECECGHLHASVFSDVIIRDPKDFSVCDKGKPGIIQVLSSIPESYPGHSLLTEDKGVLLGEDDCPCGRKGKYFRVLGRLKNAEIRGCSDTYAAGIEKGARKESSTENTLWSKVQFLVGDKDQILNLRDIPPITFFSDKVVSFLEDVSSSLMKDPQGKKWPDIVTLGFWLRHASLLKMKDRFDSNQPGLRQGRGVAFHIAPSNVPVNFAYSLFAALLCGNASVVRVPSKDFHQVSFIISAIHDALTRHVEMKPYINLVRYDRNSEINDYFSSVCDTRIIWGGDATIQELRQSPLSPRANEITFADRYSIAVIDADEYIVREDRSAIAKAFYNDTYLSDQNACTSPRMVVWIGESAKVIADEFWSELHAVVEDNYNFQEVMGVDKLTQLCLAATDEEGFEGLKLVPTGDNLIYRIGLDKVNQRIMDYRGNCGCFYEYFCDDIMEIRDVCDDMRCQTVGLLGDPSILTPLFDSGIHGVDRVVPIGHTMDFDLVWDGYDLTRVLTREISVRQNKT